tara:strand:+ start:9674 stop:9886 length:213 start_codon:yes stop_codon:yes gene_type:complete
MPDDIDSMQNQALKGIDKRLTALEQQVAEQRVQFTELMTRIDVLMKVGRYVMIAVGASVGIDLAPYAMGE